MSEITCSIDGCNGVITSKGFCQAHYKRSRNGSNMLLPVQKRNRLEGCCLDGCKGIYYAKCMCHIHYQQHRRSNGNASTEMPRNLNNGAKCSVGGCKRKSTAKGMCDLHYQRVRAGIPLDKKINRRKGSGSINSGGYMSIWRDGKRIFEHRVVMESHIGRPLQKNENVHHINGVKDDNRLENLELWSTSQPSGQRVSDKVKWAREILELYSDWESPA